MPKPARAKQPGRRPTNEKFVRFEPDTFALLVAVFERNQPESMNSIVNKAVRQYCARELGAREPETFESVINHALDIALEDARRAKETTA